ncbi:MAG TPA: tyrosine-protein phosphatase [Pyrinomonadaceae bacterium]|jgi:protein tyrosine/serine phosphatase|nr:tyrosine-protein phosphatase [Pyrinomonadaceae bacterium]
MRQQTMTGRLNRLKVIAASFMLLAVVAAGAGSQESQEKLLPNFHQVNEHLYRGAQPLSGGMRLLATKGIKTIVNLRGEDEGTRVESTDAREAGLRYFNVPMKGLSRPTDEQVEKVLAIINDSQNWPVFVHCNHGKDRTGTIIACYRISHDGWTSEKAKAEAKHYGMSWVQFGMKDYIKDYYDKHRMERPAQPLKVSLSSM